MSWRASAAVDTHPDEKAHMLDVLGHFRSGHLRPLRTAAVLGALLAAACAHPVARRGDLQPSPSSEAEGGAQREEGLASFYARSLEGRRTASGVRYDGRAMTCAHPSHAFGTLLRVTDVETGKSVVVKVTDRGPFTRGRVVDLSWAAARALGIVERGLARVVIEVVRADD